MADINDLSCYIESDNDLFLSGSVNYSTECSDDHGISDISVSVEMEVQPYRFGPKLSDNESVDLGKDSHIDDTHPSTPERVGNNHW